ncbi:dienelactone hydrolase [Dactylonectria estremocensis]|uniref:Dienelactone hydrolase n=1 Tax=Dactylonectria estremocensis TaxID=1079267 RepID=A0A9P9J3G4_9HYPO|nr:dienelactone hydrolase [Dactylonectria estremocensis]
MSCPACFQGSVHEGQPRGKDIKLHGFEAYVTEPADGRQVKGIVVVIPDAFGWEFVNTRLLADVYADKGDYKVYLPDFMNGHAAPVWMLEKLVAASETGNYLAKAYHIFGAICAFIPFMYHNNIGKTFPVARGFFEQLRKEEGSTLPVGAAGFCWGGKHVILLAQDGVEIDGRPLIDAGFTGHPSFLSLPGDVEKVVLPVSIAVGDKDNQIKAHQAPQVKEILEGKPDGAKGEVRIYEDATHGFALRAAVDMDDLAKKASEAEDQCISWFNGHLLKTSS